MSLVNSFLASGDFWRLLVTFANSLYPNQALKMLGLILIQTVCVSDGTPERNL